jgi:DNA-binding NtrC family response regulator
MTSENKILIVDDEENIRWVFAQALEEKPMTVHTAASAEEALEKMANHNYLLVFTDIFMPGMGGMDLPTANTRHRHDRPGHHEQHHPGHAQGCLRLH